MTYEQLQLSGCGKTESNREKSPSCRWDSPASPTHLRERVSAMVTSVTCGERLPDVSESLNRSGSSVKIRPVCLPELVRNTSAEYLPTLPRWGTACRGEYGELATSERLTSETGCLLSVGTPTCTATKRSAKFRAGRTPNLQEFVEKFPTPLSSDAIRVRYSSGNGGKLNPTWVEWLMGFPKNYTEVD